MIFRFLPKLIYALAASLCLFTFGLFSARSRFLIYQIATLLGWDRKRRAELLPKIPVAKVLSDPLTLMLHNPAPKGGNVTFLELAIIVDLARSRKVGHVFEIGTFDGRTARNLAAIVPANGCVYTLDLPAEMLDETEFKLAKGESVFVDKPRQGGQFLGTPEEARIQQLLGDSAKFDFSPYAGKMDMVFVDGSHAYDYVWSDSMNALTLLKPEGGLILWHDYTGAWPELTHALNQLASRESRLRDLRHIEGTTLAYLEVSRP
jgi:predicted O-methyltransferase YrrM